MTLHTFTSDRNLHVVFLICHDLFYDHLFCAENRARSSNLTFINENFIIWIRKFEMYDLKQAIEQVIHVFELIIYMQKFLHADWLRACQLIPNSAKT